MIKFVVVALNLETSVGRLVALDQFPQHYYSDFFHICPLIAAAETPENTKYPCTHRMDYYGFIKQVL
jgi:hypothetical protein